MTESCWKSFRWRLAPLTPGALAKSTAQIPAYACGYTSEPVGNGASGETPEARIRSDRAPGQGSISGESLNDAPPGTAPSMQMVVSDIRAAHDQRKAYGVEASDVDVRDWGSFVYLADSDGNKWAVQYLPGRANG